MPKINLFIKIYLCFLLTIIFTIGVVFILDRLTGSGPMIDHLRHDISRFLAFHAQESVSIVEREGVQRVQNFIDHLEQSTGIKAFLFDGKGNEITGRPENKDIKNIADTARKSSRPEIIFSGKSSMAAQSVRSKEGGIFVFAAQFPRPHTPPPFPPGLPPIPFFGPALGHLPGHPPGPPPDVPFYGIPLHFLVRLSIALIISGLACYLLARYLTKPIVTLGNATRQLAAGNLSTRVIPSLWKGKDEISELAVDFDIMAERIEKLLTAQRNLLRDVSHELRSPLARLNVALELCRQQFGSEAGKPLDRIEREAERLNELIGQILTVNKSESGASEFITTKVDLAKLVREITADADYEAKSRNRSVVSTVVPCIMEGDPDLLRRAIENVVRNAVRYTEENSSVEVVLRNVENHDRRQAEITIRDYGTGIPEEDLSQVFEPFYRADEGRDRDSGGVGLGLAITKAAVRQHGGNIQAENAPGGGLIVTITLPAC